MDDIGNHNPRPSLLGELGVGREADEGVNVPLQFPDTLILGEATDARGIPLSDLEPGPLPARQGGEAADVSDAPPVISLLDVQRRWGHRVVAAVARSTGQTIERVKVRAHAPHQVAGSFDRTLVPIKGGRAAMLYSFDRHLVGQARDEIALAPAARSHMTCIIAAPFDPESFGALTDELVNAAAQHDWRCPKLVVFVDAELESVRDEVLHMPWPPQMEIEFQQVQVRRGASALWNAVLDSWRRLEAQREPDPVVGASAAGVLEPLSGLPGLIGAGLVDLDTGLLLADGQVGQASTALHHSAQALAVAWTMHAWQSGEDSEGSAPEELMISSADRVHLLRPCAEPNTAAVLLMDRSVGDVDAARRQLRRVLRPS